MAKKFLDILADAHDDEELGSLIPHQRKTSSKRKKEANTPVRRKKRFRDSIDEAIPAETRPKSNRRSLLETLEEAFDGEVFDHLFPKKRGLSEEETRSLESRFSTMITTQVLARARQIAEAKGIRVKDVINTALKIYVEQEWENIDSD
ncbi:MAG: hypothetical protein AAF804_11885 [Bacteroidota bacterium]